MNAKYILCIDKTNPDVDIDTGILNIKIFSVRWFLDALSNTYALFEAQWVQKIRITEDEVKKLGAYKRACIRF